MDAKAIWGLDDQLIDEQQVSFLAVADFWTLQTHRYRSIRMTVYTGIRYSPQPYGTVLHGQVRQNTVLRLEYATWTEVTPPVEPDRVIQLHGYYRLPTLWQHSSCLCNKQLQQQEAILLLFYFVH